MTRTQKRQASRSRQIIADDVLPMPKLKPTETRTVGQWRLKINSRLSDEDSAIFVAQLDNQPATAQREICQLWQAHLDACAVYGRMYAQGTGDVTDADLKAQRITVVQTGIAASGYGRDPVSWQPILGDCPHSMPEHLCIECRDTKRRNENQ